MSKYSNSIILFCMTCFYVHKFVLLLFSGRFSLVLNYHNELSSSNKTLLLYVVHYNPAFTHSLEANYHQHKDIPHYHLSLYSITFDPFKAMLFP